MGGVNGKGKDDEVFPVDVPQFWGHSPIVYGDIRRDEGDELQLPTCQIISDFDKAPVQHAPGHGYSAPKSVAEVSVPMPKEQLPPLKQEPPPTHSALPTAETAETGEIPHTDGQSGCVSELHGRRKSVLIGINYFGSAHELHGCVDDVHRMLPLVEKWGFAQDGCCQVLLDAPGHEKRPTRANIKAAIAWLVDGASAGDALFLHYSGHGGRVPRTDGRGEWHETLCPADMDEEGMIHDNELFEMLVKPLPKGCRLTCILDACHSAGALDLPFIFTGTPENIKKAMAGEAIQMALSKNWVRDFECAEENPMALLGDVASVGLGLWDMWRQYKNKTEANQDGFCPDAPGNIGMTSAEVVAITGCASDQTSADVGDVHSQFDLKDTSNGGQIKYGQRGDSGGALTCAFIEAMEMVDRPHGDGATVSILELLEHLRGRLAEGGFSQVPQLASSLVLNLKQPFSLTTIIGQSAGNDNLGGNPNSTRTLPCTSNSGGGLMGSLGNGLGNAMTGSAYQSPGMVGGDGGLLGALAGLGGAWMGGHQSHQDAVAPAGPEAEDMYGDESQDEDAILDDDFEEDFEDEYSDYDEDD